MKKSWIALLVGTSSLLTAYEPMCEPCDDCCWDFYAMGEFLWWKPYLTSFPFVLSVEQAPIPEDFGDYDAVVIEHDVKLKFSPGFRAGLGISSNKWDLSLIYTQLNSSSSANHIGI